MQPLEVEDTVVQPAAFVSPPKWHLAHTTWFFVNFLLQPHNVHCPWPSADYPLLFNSYYKSQGNHWQQAQRGALSRPTLREILQFRHQVDAIMIDWLNRFDGDIPPQITEVLRLGLAHEQQHQELLLMDIKYILWSNPGLPTYATSDYLSSALRLPAVTTALRSEPSSSWQSTCGIYDFGVNRDELAFCFDNETPRHKQWLSAFRITTDLVTNGDYLDFISDGGYVRPEYWLSEGWDWVQAEAMRSEAHTRDTHTPLYWLQRDAQWFEFGLDGLQPLSLNAPVMHINFHEAYAYARWSGKRLPTEYEWELFAQHTHLLTSRACQPVWQWTASPYSAYPGYRAAQDAFGEYNGKFMINQMVLRGGCSVTPAGHARISYRNFYYPHQRWPFTGLRLAEDAD
ncbi:ergothioneine biosynthesis protein EgtB [Pseudomaricurvus hydrocarbonicus]